MPVIAVLGTKGGVSKSTLSMGLAIWMAKLKPEDRCLLIDGDMHVRSVELKMCPVYDTTLKDVLAGAKPWEEAIYACELEEGGQPLYPKLAVLPAGGRFMPPMRGSPLVYFDTTKKAFSRMINGLRERFKYIIIDTPASISLEHLILTASADAIIYVCEPNDDSINSTLLTAQELKDFIDAQTLGTVLSRVPEDVNVERWVTKIKKIAPLLATIPEDPKVGESFRENLPVAAAYPDSPASLAMKDITRKVLGTKIKQTEVAQKIDRGFAKVMERVEESKK